MNPRKLRSFLILTIGAFTVARTLASEYVIRSGDTLSQVAAQMIQGRVWGKDGSVVKILALNSEIKNPNIVLIGQRVKLPSSPLATNGLSNLQTPASEDAASVSPTTTTAAFSTDSNAGEFQEHSAITLVPIFSFSRINATDRANGTQSTLGSALNLGAELDWRQYWSTGFQTALLISTHSNSYSTTSSTHSLDHSDFLLGSVELEARWVKLASPEFFVQIGAIQTPFIRGESETANILDAVTTPDVGLGVRLPIYHSQIFLMSFEGSAPMTQPVQIGKVPTTRTKLIFQN